jgi:hypothetical protein
MSVRPEIAALIAAGHTDTAIAKRLGIDRTTANKARHELRWASQRPPRPPVTPPLCPPPHPPPERNRRDRQTPDCERAPTPKPPNNRKDQP